MAHRPLHDVRVLDVTNVLAGPFCCHLLAHMGADVIKVEMPGAGDLARQLGADPALNERHMGASFLAQNAGKRSLTINLKSLRGKDVFRRLARHADVLVENFRPGVMDRLGVGFEALKSENPRLIYCAISGFGQDGPLRDLPAYDQIIQGMSGLMSVTGAPENAPYRVGYPIADTIGGLTAAFAVTAQLAHSNRNKALFVDVSMLEATMATMGWAISNYLVAGRTPRPMGNDNFTASPSGTFDTGDGPLNIAANTQQQFESLCDLVGEPALKVDPRFADRQARLVHRAALQEILERALAARSAAEWTERFNAVGVPAGPVLSIVEALEHPQIRDRGMIGEFSQVTGLDRSVRVVGTGFKLDGQAPSVNAPPPTLGQHTEEILNEIGFSADEIDALRQEAAV